MISEIFSTSFLFSIAIIIILVGGLFAYFNHRFSEQNHKMQSMLGLVSTMAEEMQYFRSKLNSRPNDNNYTESDNIQIIPNFLGETNRTNNIDLIEVSDDEDDLEDDEDDLEDDEDDSDLEEEEEDEDDDSDSNDSDDDDDDDRKIINIDLGMNNNDIVIDSEDINSDSIPEDNFNIEHSNLEDANLEDANLEDANLEDANLEDIDASLKSISINDISTNFLVNKGKIDYKKMSLNKLREVVVEKGLIVDASKLKKNDLLKMLGDE